MKTFEIKSALVIVAATLAAGLLATENHVATFAGVALVASLAAASLRSSWYGLLALLPMAFAIQPAPSAIGLHEITFALLAGIAFLKGLLEEIADTGWRGLAVRYRWPLALTVAWAGVNFLIAHGNGVTLADWLRGAVPFTFLIFALPFARLVIHPFLLPWLAWAVAAYIILLAGHVVGYFLLQELYKPYWLVVVGDAARRISAAALATAPHAVGPFFDRVTLYLPRATSALLPAGLTMAFAVSVRARTKYSQIAAMLISALCLEAILVTWTRSMLLAATAAIIIFLACLIWGGRRYLPRALGLAGLLIVLGGVTVMMQPMKQVWSSRIEDATHASKASNASNANASSAVTIVSRIDELRVAWRMFLDRPLLGNGLGVKHTIIFVDQDGPVQHHVAYIHNWLFYSLMVGGVVGGLLYALLLLSPIVIDWKSVFTEPVEHTAVRIGMLTLTIYGLAFAVFRLIDFNLFVALAWAVMLVTRATRKEDVKE